MTQTPPLRRTWRWWLAALMLAPGSALANPTAVSLPGDYQDKGSVGCASSWSPQCEATQLAYDADDDVWQGTFTIPAGSHLYKAALNKSWDVNYGANAQPNGANISLQLDAERAVKFYYDHKTNWVTDDVNSIIATAVGDFQSELGCGGDWQPDCLRGWLQDIDGDGIYTFTTPPLPEGDYQGKVALNENWDVNYGAGGVAGGDNIAFSIPAGGEEVTFRWDSVSKVLEINVGTIRGSLAKAKAHWLTRNTLAWNVIAPAGATFRLHYDPEGKLELDPTGVRGGQSIVLTAASGGLPQALRDRFPHLRTYRAFHVAEADVAKVPDILRGQVALSAVGQDDKPLDVTAIQPPGVLDDLYTYDGPLGVTWNDGVPTLRLWAPTAQDVKLLVFPSADSPMSGTFAMVRDPATGVWSYTGLADWKNAFYLYEVTVYSRAGLKVSTHTVTDPYSLSLSTNSKRSQMVDLDDPALKPQGWDRVSKPAIAAPEDIVLYELHIRDFSASDPSVPEDHRGGYLAFTHLETHGMKHLRRLAKAGLTHVHLLPTFDIATIDEDRANWKLPAGDLASFPGNSEEQRKAVKAVIDQDGFNWGYDPFHFGVPEGSYSTDPNGPQRIIEFRQMVKALNEAGLRVVMDVVYNHTNASGLNDKSVLDRVVPDYYHRLNAEGGVERSTCCDNTATEHAMMERLMVDTLLTWTRDYKVDGYRFDLMGHHMKSNMLKVRDTLAALTPARDGVDGSKVYVYGEGWNFGEVQDNARGENGIQRNMAGTGIGSFNDRLRDAVRGGTPFSARTQQGFLTGLYFSPNASEFMDAGGQHERLLHSADLIRAGLAATLKDYSFLDATGRTGPAAGLDYGGQQAGYTTDPQEVINYISAHDNETLFDAIQMKAPVDMNMDERVRINNLGVSINMLAQGIPFFHAGDELLRSKSGDHNSYNSGDWFNRLDFTYQTNNWGVGLPVESDDAVLRPLLDRPELKPTPADITRALEHFEEMLKIRKSSKLFRLETADQVKAAVKFLNVGPLQDPGLIVVSISNVVGLTDEYDQVVVAFNTAPFPVTFRSEQLKGVDLRLHPVQMESTDPVVRKARFTRDAGAIVVPGRTAAVFVQGKLDEEPAPAGCGCTQTNSTGLALAGLLLLAGMLRRRGTRPVH
jgi:pullulanase